MLLPIVCLVAVASAAAPSGTTPSAVTVTLPNGDFELTIPNTKGQLMLPMDAGPEVLEDQQRDLSGTLQCPEGKIIRVQSAKLLSSTPTVKDCEDQDQTGQEIGRADGFQTSKAFSDVFWPTSGSCQWQYKIVYRCVAPVASVDKKDINIDTGVSSTPHLKCPEGSFITVTQANFVPTNPKQKAFSAINMGFANHCAAKSECDAFVMLPNGRGCFYRDIKITYHCEAQRVKWEKPHWGPLMQAVCE